MKAVPGCVLMESGAAGSGFSWMLLSLSGMHARPGLIGLAGSPSGRGDDWVSHIAIPNQNAGGSSKLKDWASVGMPVGASGSVGKVNTYCTRFPLPGWSEQKSSDGSSWQT